VPPPATDPSPTDETPAGGEPGNTPPVAPPTTEEPAQTPEEPPICDGDAEPAGSEGHGSPSVSSPEQPPQSTVDPVPQAPDPNSQAETGSSVAPVPSKEDNDFVFLPHSNRLQELKVSGWGSAITAEDCALIDQLGSLGFFSQANSVELVPHAEGPALRVRYSFGMMQFLLSDVRSWLPPR
jgi:hypothetical protein